MSKHILDDSKYSYLFSVEEVNRLVLSGTPFRDAYKLVGKQIEDGKFNPDTKIQHTHEGSIGNLCNDKIAEKFTRNYSEFDKVKIDKVKKGNQRLPFYSHLKLLHLRLVAFRLFSYF